LKENYGQPYNSEIPIGEIGTSSFIKELSTIIPVYGKTRDMERNRNFGLLSYQGRVENFRRSINAEQLKRKKAFVFGSFSQAWGVAKFLAHELDFPVVSVGTYSLDFENRLRMELADLSTEVFATADFLEVKRRIEAARPDLILGTQMERHIGADLNIPCVVISNPVHLETFPLSFKPIVGWRGAAYLADTVVSPLNLGLEDDLKKMFGEEEDKEVLLEYREPDLIWREEALRELKKIPFFVRGKARATIEEYARRKKVSEITLKLMYEAKEQAMLYD